MDNDKIYIGKKSDILKNGVIDLGKTIVVRKKDLQGSQGLTIPVSDNHDPEHPRTFTATATETVGARVLSSFYYMLALNQALSNWVSLMAWTREDGTRLPRKFKKEMKTYFCREAARNTSDWITPYGVLRRLNKFIKRKH